MGQGQNDPFGSHRQIASQQNRANSGGYNQNTGGFTQGSAMPRGRRGGVGRGHLRGGTGDQMQNMFGGGYPMSGGSPLSMAPNGSQPRPGMTNIQTPDFMSELNETFGNSPFRGRWAGQPQGTTQVARMGGGRGGVAPDRQELLQNRLNQGAIQNAAMQGMGRGGYPMMASQLYGSGYGGYGGGPMTTPAGVVDPYMVQQALGQGNAQDATEYSIYGPEAAGGMPRGGYGGLYGGNLSDDGIVTTPAMANQYDLNFDNAVGADDLGMALKAQAAGRAYDPAGQYGELSMDDMQAGFDRQQGIREQYGGQPQYSPFDPRPIDEYLDDIGQSPGPQTPVPQLPPRGPSGPRFRGWAQQGRNQTRGQRRPGGGRRGYQQPESDIIYNSGPTHPNRRRQFGHGGIIDAYGRRLI